MKKTFALAMPNRSGEFLSAVRVFLSCSLNITRVSYNKALDSHMIFTETEGEPENIKKAASYLKEMGYLKNISDIGRVILTELSIKGSPDTLTDVLKVIENHKVNISYISSEGKEGFLNKLKLGLFVPGGGDISALLDKLSLICPVKIKSYNPSDISLDNTVFYVTFANSISEIIPLTEDEKRSLMIDSNIIMERLSKKNAPPYKTFEYIGKFAEGLLKYQNGSFSARVTSYRVNELKITLIEPPCGSNTCIIENGDYLLCIDGGFACYAKETLGIIKKYYPDFESRRKSFILTHADLDHVGLSEYFDSVYLSKKCFDNFMCDMEGRPDFREQNPDHAPYMRISKLLLRYEPINPLKLKVIGGNSQRLSNLTERIGTLSLGGLDFDCFEGMGGHVPGETVYIDRKNKIIFTGDIIVNIKSFIPPQAEFNSLAPFLMTSVDTDPHLAAEERKEIKKLLSPGRWLLFGGHGAPIELDI